MSETMSGEAPMDFGDESEFEYGDEEEFEFDDEPVAPSPGVVSRKVKYKILGPGLLKDRQQENVQQIVDLLNVGSTEAARVLRFYKWDVSKLQDEWFTDADAVREKVGLVDEQPATRKKRARCPICFDDFDVDKMSAARCKHYCCSTCWQGYVHASIDGGPTCLDLRCPDPECKAVVPRSLVVSVADDAHKKRYEAFELRSFVDDNKSLVWCTAPDCSNAVEATVDVGREALDVFCNCGNAFCFTCKEEAHRPVDCGTVHRWMIKNSAESENMTWILANTKPCPKCTRPIEKNQGCMHMTCSQCRHEFCWLCLDPWSEHGERTGGFYNCNVYKRKLDKGEIDEDEQQRNHARQSLERYMHYWQRWAEHDKARKTAHAQMLKWENEQLEELGERVATPPSQLKFVLDAWKEVENCRRVLKWTYAVGYYTFDDPGNKDADREAKAAAKEFFEFTQMDAESALERMNHKVEKQLQGFLRADSVNMDEWNAFKEELMGLTDVTRTQFSKLVDFLEKGLDAGLQEYATVNLPEPMDIGDKAGPSTSAQPTTRRVTRSMKRGWSAEGDVNMLGTSVEVAAGHWQCKGCTYANALNTSQCEVCDRPRRS